MRKPGTMKPSGPRIARMQTWQTESGSHGWGQGRAAGWKATRLRILKRDGGLCQCHECKSNGRYEIAHMVDHIDNRRASPHHGIAYDDDLNLAAINRECHKRKTELEVLIGRSLAKRPAHMDRGTFVK